MVNWEKLEPELGRIKVELTGFGLPHKKSLEKKLLFFKIKLEKMSDSAYISNINEDFCVLKSGKVIYIPFVHGMYVDLMQDLTQSGYEPMSGVQIMEQRIKLASIDKELYVGRDIDGASSIIYHPDGRIKIVTSSKTILSITKTSPLRYKGSLALEEGTFDKTEGYAFSKEERTKYTDEYMPRHKIMQNPLLHALAKEDKSLVKEYVKTFCDLEDSCNISIIRDYPQFEIERLWTFNLNGNTIVDGSNYSDHGGLEFSYGSLALIPSKLKNEI